MRRVSQPRALPRAMSFLASSTVSLDVLAMVSAFGVIDEFDGRIDLAQGAVDGVESPVVWGVMIEPDGEPIEFDFHFFGSLTVFGSDAFGLDGDRLG